MRPYTHPHPEVAVAAMVTPSGPRLAGQHDVSLLSLSMSLAEGFAAIGQAWGVVAGAGRAKPGQPEPDRAHAGAILGNHAHRRDRASRPSRTAPTASRTSPTTSAAAPASCRSPTRSRASPTPREAFVERYNRGRRRRDRHARRRHRVHRGPHRAVGRLRHVPDARPRLGVARARRSTATGSSPRRSSPTSRASWRAPKASHDWATANRGELFGRADPGDGQRHHVARRGEGEGRRGSGRRATRRRSLMRAVALEVREDLRPRRRPRSRARASARCSCR